MLSIVQTQIGKKVRDRVAVLAELWQRAAEDLGQSHCIGGKCHVIVHHLIDKLP